ncbi:MAG: HU family DNA-binding protein [Deltaproteobacteria bacterium]|nr:HU family DNA-binding protein [Deltaproteobacteria bacterium]
MTENKGKPSRIASSEEPAGEMPFRTLEQLFLEDFGVQLHKTEGEWTTGEYDEACPVVEPAKVDAFNASFPELRTKGTSHLYYTDEGGCPVVNVSFDCVSEDGKYYFVMFNPHTEQQRRVTLDKHQSDYLFTNTYEYVPGSEGGTESDLYDEGGSESGLYDVSDIIYDDPGEQAYWRWMNLKDNVPRADFGEGERNAFLAPPTCYNPDTQQPYTRQEWIDYLWTELFQPVTKEFMEDPAYLGASFALIFGELYPTLASEFYPTNPMTGGAWTEDEWDLFCAGFLAPPLDYEAVYRESTAFKENVFTKWEEIKAAYPDGFGYSLNFILRPTTFNPNTGRPYTRQDWIDYVCSELIDRETGREIENAYVLGGMYGRVYGADHPAVIDKFFSWCPMSEDGSFYSVDRYAQRRFLDEGRVTYPLTIEEAWKEATDYVEPIIVPESPQPSPTDPPPPPPKPKTDIEEVFAKLGQGIRFNKGLNELVAKKMGISVKAAKQQVDTVLGAASDIWSVAGSLRLYQFGTFGIRPRAARVCTCFGKSYRLPKTVKMAFKTSKAVKNKIGVLVGIPTVAGKARAIAAMEKTDQEQTKARRIIMGTAKKAAKKGRGKAPAKATKKTAAPGKAAKKPKK